MTPDEARAKAFADFRAELEAVVVDDQREAEVVGLLSDLEREIESMTSELVASRIEIRRLNTDYDTTREEMTEFIDEASLTVIELRRRVLEARQLLRTTMTPDQWEAIQSAEARAAKAIAVSMNLL